MAFPKDAKDHIPFCFDQGIPNLVATALPGMAMQAKQITQVGASPFTVDLAAEGLAPMADGSYVVLIDGETVAAANVSQSTIDGNGFDVLGGANGEVLHIAIMGKLRNQQG